MTPLDHYRILDLTDARGLLAGRVLADLGADVVQVEPPAGHQGRRRSPRHPDGEGSYYWDAYAANKRGIALDLDSPEGQDAVRRLAQVADVVIESEGPAVQHRRGLDWEDLHAINDRLVYVSITPFGRTGPKAGYADSDLILWAAGGPLDEHRVAGRPPLRISIPQAYHHAALDAATGAQLALLARTATGAGQLVDVSVQACLGAATLGHVLTDAVGDVPRDMTKGHELEEKRVDQSGSGSATDPALKKWPCKDGLVEFHIGIGPAAGGFTNNFLQWMRAEQVDLGDFTDLDFRTLPAAIQSGAFSDDDTTRLRTLIGDFLSRRTKEQVLAAAIEFKLLCVPISDTTDVRESPQLADRDFWRTIGTGDRAVTLPGPFARTGDPLTELRRPAPLLGEHLLEDVESQWNAPSRADQRATTHTGQLPLAGLKVVDFSWVVAGPVIGRFLADFGATVVRVESSKRIETARFMQPFIGGKPGPENSALYSTWNAGKQGVTLDLQTEAGQAVARDLIDWSDVVLESFSPGLMARWGLDYDDVSADHRDLIMVSTAINGQTGPLSRLAGYGNIGASLSGFQSIVGWPDSGPVGPFGPYTDYVGPRFATLALLAALERKAATGVGTYIDVAQVEAGVWLQSAEMADNSANGTVVQKLGNADRDFAPHGVFPTSDPDRYVAVAVETDQQWAHLAELLEETDFLPRPALSTAQGRLAAATELESAVAGWTLLRTAEEAEQILQAAGVPAHVSASSHDFCTDPQLQHRHHLVRLPSNLFGEVVVEGPRVLLSATPAQVRTAAPTFGQHNRAVLTGILGYIDDRVDTLEKEGTLR